MKTDRQGPTHQKEKKECKGKEGEKNENWRRENIKKKKIEWKVGDIKKNERERQANKEIPQEVKKEKSNKERKN